ncbi:GNAT family N-acetyltransferase [Geminocystis sp. NIES-3709]|uniref:GNAT family N-acetyltransferase n=1 Tax=Geminocystis sp. NIES-3709 TaxID=1617448 RepID=UPI0005FC852B|nr:GNAT family N-acetyltransferase [Geminocystis sp. NIES-3709]BAQ66680.1 detoxification by modification [Geminocystis sp. NIES-3709]
MSILPNHILIKSFNFGSTEYYQAKEIRQKYLRTPLGIEFTPEDLNLDRIAHHIMAYDDNKIVGCVLGIQENNKVKIKQMLVIPDYQEKGIGSLLLNKIERVFYDLGINHFYLHSRQESLEFYQKNGYIPTGNNFIEVGILHQRADKFY